MDITDRFKATVKTVRLKLPPQSIPQQDKKRILTKKSDKLEIWKQSMLIKHQITVLRDFLLEHRSSYMQLAEHLKNSELIMTDADRDVIDEQSDQMYASTVMALSGMKRECADLQAKKQVKECLILVLESLYNYTTAIHMIAQEQKKFRINRQIETINFIKLQPKMKTELYTKPLETAPALGDDESPNQTTRTDNPDGPRSVDKNVSQSIEDMEETSVYDDYENDDLSPEDIQMFESENVQLYNELKGLSEEVEQIQRNVVDIAQLQSVFTEKVSTQFMDVGHINTNVVGTTENVKDANEQIKQTIQRNAGLRVWVLFFMIVMSFTLLFLDWYNE